MTPDDQPNDTGDSSPAPRSPDSPASCSSLDEDPLDLHPEPLPGRLDLLPVSLEEYLELPNEAEDRYEYVDGLLRFRPCMQDFLHSAMVDYLHAVLTFAVDTNMRVSGPVMLQTSSPRTVRIPHITVGTYISFASLAALPPLCHKISYPTIRPPPAMVVEVTGPSDSLDDLGIKSKEYFATGIDVFIIIEREHTESHPQGCVRVRTGTDSTKGHDDYLHENIYSGTDRIRCRFLDLDPPFAKDILLPPMSGTQYHHVKLGYDVS